MLFMMYIVIHYSSNGTCSYEETDCAGLAIQTLLEVSYDLSYLVVLTVKYQEQSFVMVVFSVMNRASLLKSF